MIYKKGLITILFVLTICVGIAQAQSVSKDSLYSDFKHLVKLLEETHPDPYTEFGGKVEFHKRAFDIGNQLKSKEFTADEYNSLLLAFISNLHDGHTVLSRNANNSQLAKYIPLSIKIIPDGLIVESLPSPYSKYLGARILSINQIPIDSLCKKISQLVPSENLYGEYRALRSITFNLARLRALFPELKDEISISVITANDTEDEFTLNLSEQRINNLTDIISTPQQNKSQSGYLYYKFTDDRKQTMLLKMNSIMARECYQFMKENNWPGFSEELSYFYKYDLQKDMPEDIDAAIDGIPSFAELFSNMLKTMKDNKSDNLIIDLRGNGGGFTPITLPTLYMLYGDKYMDTDMEDKFYGLISPLYMEKVGLSLAEYNKKNDTNYEFGDYTFPISNNIEKTIEQKRADFIKEAMGDASNYINDMDGKAIYSPKQIYVLTDALTFSAAFHYAFYLWKMGATIVGVPSSQAPNTFMENTDFELPYTKIKGTISNSAQYFLPVTDKKAKTFWPDIMPEYKDYKKYNFDKDSELLWLLDRINNK